VAPVPVINMRNRYASAIVCKINELTEKPPGKHVSSAGSAHFFQRLIAPTACLRYSISAQMCSDEVVVQRRVRNRKALA
jgi:hypothetical protein